MLNHDNLTPLAGYSKSIAEIPIFSKEIAVFGGAVMVIANMTLCSINPKRKEEYIDDFVLD